MFVRLLNESPMKLLCHDDNPDFLAEREGRTIGIEHTELFKRRGIQQDKPAPRRSVFSYDCPKELDGIQRRIVRDARELYVDQGNPPVSVRVWFNTTMQHTKLATGRSKAIAAELSQLVADWVRENPGHLDGQLRRGDTIPIEEIAVLAIRRGGLGWSKEGPSWVRAPSVSELQAIVTEKDARYDVYRRRCDECWLLITADWRNPAQGFDLRRDERWLSHCYGSKFDRIFFLELGDGILRELTHAVSHNLPDPIE